MRHELGHIIAGVVYGYDSDGYPAIPQEWQDARLADGKIISKYDNESIQEDFAEAMRVYLEIRGGFDNPSMAFEYRYRFNILDEVVGVNPSYREQINRRGNPHT